jgi:hypothetical protein
MDSCDLIYYAGDGYKINRADIDIEKLLNKISPNDHKLAYD